jgi:hypothetical protein
MSTTLAAGTATSGAALSSDTSGVLQLQSGSTPTTAVTIDTAQNVGVGGSPSAQLHVIGNSDSYFTSGGRFTRYQTAGQYGTINFANGTYNFVATDTALSSPSFHWRFSTDGSTVTNPMTLDNSGNLLVGTTSQVSSGKICLVGSANTYNLLVIQNTSTPGSSTTLEQFVNSSGAQAGAILHTATTTVSYSTSSDERLKTDNGIATDTSVVDNIKVHNFTWKSDNSQDIGVFAQEAYSVKPSAIHVGKDTLTEDGNLLQPWGVDYSKFVPDLIVYCQQLKKQVTELSAEVTALKAKVGA